MNHPRPRTGKTRDDRVSPSKRTRGDRNQRDNTGKYKTIEQRHAVMTNKD